MDAIDIGSRSPLTSTSLQVPARGVEAKEEQKIGTWGAIGLLTSIPIIFTSVCYNLQLSLNKPCFLEGTEQFCTPEYKLFAEFFGREENALIAKGLIFTHVLPFLLIPLTMKFVYDKGAMIQEDFPEFNPFALLLGMATIGFGLAFEFGWHLSDSWYYANEFHILNYGFYFFLISGFSLWADGLDDSKVLPDVVFGLILSAATVLYPIGNALQVDPDYQAPFLQGMFEGGGSVAKIPLYAGMTLTFASITARGKKVLGDGMYLVAFLAVGVNLAFIFILNGYAYDETVTGALSTKNYIYHICHDLFGTEAGVAYFAYLIYSYTPVALRPAKPEH